MRLVYIANIRLPTEKAHGVQIMKTCEAFAALGHTVELVVPNRKTPIAEELFGYYGIQNRFQVTKLAVWDTVGFGRVGFFLESVLFAYAVRRYLRGKSFDMLYGRDELVLARMREPVVWESHTGSWGTSAQKIAREAKKIVVITQGLKEFYVQKGISAEKIVVAPDAVNLDDFAHPESKEAARTRLGLPHDKKIAMYIGRLDGWKGSETLCEASNILPDDIVVAVIGGEPHQVSELSRRYKKVKFLGYRPYKELPNNQVAADVLILPNTARDEISARFTSPLKLFTYMASGVPIVSSDLPSIREVVSEREVFFAQPDDPQSFANAIVNVANDLAGLVRRAGAARALVQRYEWKSRAKNILAVIAG